LEAEKRALFPMIGIKVGQILVITM